MAATPAGGSERAHFIPLEDLVSDALAEQQLPLSAFHLRFSESPDISFHSIAILPSNLKVVLCEYDGIESAILPVFHDFQIQSVDILPLLEQYSHLQCLLALCAPDSSIILYQLRDFEFPGVAL
jgi:hypothetical protein